MENLGYRVFTTLTTNISSQNGKTIVSLPFLRYHLERLIQNGNELGLLNVDLEEHDQQWIQTTLLRELEQLPLNLKLHIRVVLDEKGTYLFLTDYTSLWREGAGVHAISIQLDRPLPHLKTTSSVVSAYGRACARKKGVEEALLVNRELFLKEGAWSNIFWFKNTGALHTISTGVLPGVTRRAILEMTTCALSEIPLEDFFHEASEAFLSQSTTGITPLLTVDDRAIGDGAIGPLVRTLQRDFTNYTMNHPTTVFVQT